LNYAVLTLAAAERQNGNGAIVLLVQMVVIGLIFYWILIRPQRQEQARLQNMINALKKGDEVILSGGLVGTVVQSNEGRLILRSGESKVEVDRSRVVAVLNQEEPKAAATSE